jgi:hypothetical protein
MTSNALSGPALQSIIGAKHVDDLVPALSSRRWERHDSPFPHVTARRVFVPAIYESLVASFRALLDDKDTVAYNTKHDFVGLSLTPEIAGTLSLFLSRGWHDLVSRLFGVQTTGQTTAGVHRHLPRSRNGFPHNDIMPERLREAGRAQEIVDHGRAQTRSGDGGLTVRAIATLFYLNNGPWCPDLGGETGLYRNWDDPVHQPEVRVPPIDNSLLSFECSPYSYHSFLQNRNRRDSVIVFFYHPIDNFVQLWGTDGLQQYADAGKREI